VQVEPIKSMFEATGTNRLKLKCDQLLSSFDFKLNLRRYNKRLADMPSSLAAFCGRDRPHTACHVMQRTLNCPSALKLDGTLVSRIEWRVQQCSPGSIERRAGHLRRLRDPVQRRTGAARRGQVRQGLTTCVSLQSDNIPHVDTVISHIDTVILGSSFVLILSSCHPVPSSGQDD
jgi:hypothetical protein